MQENLWKPNKFVQYEEIEMIYIKMATAFFSFSVAFFFFFFNISLNTSSREIAKYPTIWSPLSLLNHSCRG